MKIGVLLADAFQDSEYFLPKYELERAGARTEVISLDSKPVEIYSYFLVSACSTSIERSAMRIRSTMPGCWFPVARRARRFSRRTTTCFPSCGVSARPGN